MATFFNMSDVFAIPGAMQDTPPVNLAGAADSILYHIQKQSHHYLSNEDNPTRRRPVSSFVDCRVDACLYLVPPHSELSSQPSGKLGPLKFVNSDAAISNAGSHILSGMLRKPS